MMQTCRKYQAILLVPLFLLSACQPQPTTMPASPTVSPKPAATTTPSPTLEPTRSSDEIFGSAADGIIPLIFSHGGAPSDIDAAVFLDKHPSVDLIGMVLTRGEFRPPDAVDDWPRFILDALGSQNTEFGLGSDETMDPNPNDFPESWRPGAGNFWGIPLPAATSEFDLQDGPQLIVDLVNDSPEKVTILACASMIDVALALQQDPGIIENINQVVIMGGAVTMMGNLSDAPEPNPNIWAEWNMYIDAAAAQFIMESGVPVSLVPLDATQYLVTRNDISRIDAINDPEVAYVEKIWRAQMSWWDTPFLIWDTIAAVAVTNPEHFQWVVDGLAVTTEAGDHLGQTVPLNNGAQHIRYAPDADYYAIMETLFNNYAGNDNFYETVADAPITALGGRWSGDTAAFQINFEFEPECMLGTPCGMFTIPDFNLSGGVVITEIRGNRFVFVPTILSDGMHSTAAFEYLETLPNGNLKYYTQGRDGTSNEGILTRE